MNYVLAALQSLFKDAACVCGVDKEFDRMAREDKAFLLSTSRN
jgi:hypothetical protein